MYFDGWIHEIGTSLECEGCVELKNRIEALAVRVFIGLCVPEICNRDEIREELAPSSRDVNLYSQLQLRYKYKSSYLLRCKVRVEK